jgi:hypothetical protein
MEPFYLGSFNPEKKYVSKRPAKNVRTADFEKKEMAFLTNRIPTTLKAGKRVK